MQKGLKNSFLPFVFRFLLMSHDFVHTYFTQAIIEQGVAGYNIVNTSVYAIGFAIAVIGAYKLLKKLNIKVDRNFVLGILPFILLGSALRVVRDSTTIPSPLLVSPLIYFSIFIIATTSLLVGVGVARKTKFDYHKIWGLLGIVALAVAAWWLAPIGVQNWPAVGLITVITAGWAIVIFGVYKSRIFKWLTFQNSGLLGAHMFDATTTFVALQFFASAGYYEQHVVSNAVIGFLGPAGQFILKLAVVPPVLYLLDRELKKPEDAQLRGFLKVAILLLGLAPGLRNALRLALGV